MTLIHWLFNLLYLMSGGLADLQAEAHHPAPHCALTISQEN